MKTKNLINIVLIIFPSLCNSQAVFSSQKWVQDATTISFGHPERKSFTGLRFVFEPQLGVCLQSGQNRFENNSFKGLEKIGFETNLEQGYVSFQGLFIYPSNLQFDEKSPLRINHNLTDSIGRVGVDYGFALGLSFFDGILAIGYGSVFYDRRDFQNTIGMGNGIFKKGFIYFNIQAISTLKAAIKNLGRPEGKGLRLL